MRLTEEQRDAVDQVGHVCLVSCPGSGKTRAIVAKLLWCVESVKRTTRRVACITHTNAAADEVDSRLRRLCFGDEDRHYEVATIHAFALQNILTPFHHYLPELANGFKVLTSDCDEYVTKARELMTQYKLNGNLSEEFERISRNPDGAIRPMDSLPVGLQEDWCAWLDHNAYVTFSDMLYHAGRLVSHYQHIASALASRFAWILIDEFQDSSASQMVIFEAIYSFGRTHFFCVGDPNQSIYRFAGASPELLPKFAARIAANTEHVLSGNFRSSQKIVTLAERLCPTNPRMQAVGEYAGFPMEPIHHVVASPLEGILSRFIPVVRDLGIPLGETAILAPWWIPLYNLGRGLRAQGLPVIGPGARPYKRSHLIAQLLESLGAHLETRDGDSAFLVQRSLFVLLTDISNRAIHEVFSFRGRVTVCRILAAARAAQDASPVAVNWIPDVASRITDILPLIDVPEEALVAIAESASAMVADIRERDGGGQLLVSDLGIFGRPKECIQLLTIHKAKGREFEAVAIIDAHDGKLPHFTVQHIQDAQERAARYDETRRVMYVAATRAKRVLMFFTDQTHPKNRPSPFLREMGLEPGHLLTASI